MASNQNSGTQGGTPQQHAEAGRQSHKNDTRQGNQADRDSTASASSGGTQQGQSQSPRQQQQDDGLGGRANASNASHADRQNQSGNSANRSGTGTQGGTSEQHAAAGRQSHKNDR